MPYKKKTIPGTGQFNQLIFELPEQIFETIYI